MHKRLIPFVFMALCATSVAGQVEFADRVYGVAMGIGIVNDPPAWFTNAICPDEHPTRYQFAGGIRLRGPVHLRAGASRYSDNPDLCIDGLIPPVPDTGPYTQRGISTEADIIGYPFWTLDLQLGAEAYLQDALLGRASLGTIWIPSKDVVGFIGTIGTGLRIPSTPLVLSLTFEQQWLTIPYVDIVLEYFDGQIEDARITPTSDHVSPNVLTLGLELWW